MYVLSFSVSYTYTHTHTHTHSLFPGHAVNNIMEFKNTKPPVRIGLKP